MILALFEGLHISHVFFFQTLEPLTPTNPNSSQHTVFMVTP
jgi:hypothetical protein